MKRKLTIALVTVLLAIMLVWSTGCGKGNVAASPSPALTPVTTPKLSPMVTQSAAPAVSPAGSPGMSPGTSPAGSPGGTIEGFVEGGQVDPAKVPDVVKAVEKKYPDTTIKTITYALYNTEQVYQVELEGKNANMEKVYVRADGTIVENAANG